MTTPEEQPNPVYGTPEWNKKYAQPLPDEKEFWIEQIREERLRHKEEKEKQSGFYLGMIALIVVIIVGVMMGNAESY
jgi:hypothetical protein